MNREQMEKAKKMMEAGYKVLMTLHNLPVDHSDKVFAFEISIKALQALLDTGEVFFNKLNYADYTSFEKYTECEHKTADAIGGDCQACDTAWLIGRCKALEKACSEDIAIVAKKMENIGEVIQEVINKEGYRPTQQEGKIVPLYEVITLAITQHLKGAR